MVGLSPFCLPAPTSVFSGLSLTSSPEGQLLAGDLASRLPAARTKKQSGPPPPAPQKRLHRRCRPAEWGVGTTEHNEGPLECCSKFLKSQLLECEARTTSSLGAKCVCHYSRSFVRAAAAAASVARVRGARSERTADPAPWLLAPK